MPKRHYSNSISYGSIKAGDQPQWWYLTTSPPVAIPKLLRSALPGGHSLQMVLDRPTDLIADWEAKRFPRDDVESRKDAGRVVEPMTSQNIASFRFGHWLLSTVAMRICVVRRRAQCRRLIRIVSCSAAVVA
jgi:hypothetical protein